MHSTMPNQPCSSLSNLQQCLAI